MHFAIPDVVRRDHAVVDDVIWADCERQQVCRHWSCGLEDSAREAIAWIDHPVVMIDTETTGRDPSTERVVELAVVRGAHGQIVSRNAWLINPGGMGVP